MNKLTYNGTSLHDLGVLKILGLSTSRTPEEVRRERVTMRCRLDLFERTYAANKQKVDAVRAALRTQNAVLNWEDPSGAVKVNRQVFIGDDAQPDNENSWGTYRQSVEFTFWFYRYDIVDATALALSFTPSGGGSPIDLGVVTQFNDHWAVGRYNQLRDARTDSVGTVSITGRFVVTDDTKTIEQKRVLLQAQAALMDAAMKSQSRGRLLRTGVFDQTVRIAEFVPRTDEFNHCIDWTLTGTYTRFPNEDNYALVDIMCQTRQNPATGVLTRTLNGRIGANSLDAALTKRDLVRAAFGLDSQYILISQDPAEHDVDTISAGTAESGDADGKGVFIELTVNEEWQLCGTGGDSNILDSAMRKVDSDSLRSGFIRTVYAGQVRARGATQADAFTNAAAKATALGGGKFPFLVQSDVTQTSFQDVTANAATSAIVTCEFSYEYQRRGARTYFEVTADVDSPTFGSSVENVNGFIAAPSLSAAQTAYAAEILSLYPGALILNERKPSAVLDWSQKVGGEEQWDRYGFALQVHRDKAAGTTAVKYELTTVDDFVNPLRNTTVEGTFWTDTAVNAATALATFLGSLSLGNQLNLRTFSSNLKYNNGVSTQTGFQGLSFSSQFESTVTGADGLLESTVTERMVYSGDNLVVRRLPAGAPIIQHLGTTEATRNIEAMAVAVTEATARTWVTGLRSMLSSPEADRHEMPAQVSASFEFLKRTTSPVPRGGGANARVCRVTGSFGEIISNLALS